MYYLCCAEIGYILGSISPSYIIGKIKGTDLRESGTKNLGASNTFMHFGRFWGTFVMLFDILKAVVAVKLCEFLFREIALAGIISGAFSVLGHNYPFYLGFKGGKGLASFGGFVLAVSPVLFAILLPVCLIVAIIANYGCILSLSAAVLFPILAGLHFMSIPAALVCVLCSVSVFYKHTENLRRIRSGEETKLRDFLGRFILKLKKF